MFRLWAKLWQDNHLIGDTTIEDSSEDTRTHKVFRAVEESCIFFDLPKPIWLDKNVREFKSGARTRFYKECFIEEVPFDFLEIQIIEEDD